MSYLVTHRNAVILVVDDERKAMETYKRAREQWPDDEVRICEELRVLKHVKRRDEE